MDPGAEPGRSTRILGEMVKIVRPEGRTSHQPALAAFHSEFRRIRWEQRNKDYGPELASTTAIKAALLPGVISPDRITLVSANDNVALVAANDNTVVAARLAA